jgi:DNA-binding GntR family transcriptional regulator
MQFGDLQEIDMRADVESKVARYFDMNQKQRAELWKSLPPAIAETLSYDPTSIQQELEAAKHDSWQPYLDCVTSWPVLEVRLTGHLSVPEPIELSPRVLYLRSNKFIDATSFDCHVAIAIT